MELISYNRDAFSLVAPPIVAQKGLFIYDISSIRLNYTKLGSTFLQVNFAAEGSNLKCKYRNLFQHGIWKLPIFFITVLIHNNL